ncbi:MFS transporter [Solwaraspora sp. WMMD1047]|uniref:MFS transporter n=1 Tax=Solwaraspora sp. WMMD1047 TaxID=3016102 RepID=UPI002415E10E|nr:MFS transporter [Solwaraspora sp. WMMD1047]MDG4831174.1 MFS transporter [Solwaraspora sp. WMMD1047]
MTATLEPLRYLTFRLLVVGRTVTMLGNSVAPIALGFAVLDLTGSARDLGLVVGARSVTNVVFVLFGGVLADRLPRGLVLVGASAFAAGTQLAVAASVLTGTATIPLLIGLSAVNGIAGAIALPAASALLPQTVPAEVRQQANAINRLGFNGAMILGASIGGVLVAAVGPGWGLAVDAAAFALAAIVFSRLRVPSAAADPVDGVGGGPARVIAELREGWAEVSSRTWLWVVVAGAAVVNAALAGGLHVLGPVVADETIGRLGWGLVLATETAGMVIGGIIALRLRIRRFLRFGVICSLGDVLLLGALGLTPRLGVLLLCAFVAGVAFEQLGVAWETTIQEHVPPEKLARVYSYDMLGSLVAVPIGQLAAGPLADAYGARATLVGAAVLCALALLGILLSREVREIQNTLPATG